MDGVTARSQPRWTPAWTRQFRYHDRLEKYPRAPARRPAPRQSLAVIHCPRTEKLDLFQRLSLGLRFTIMDPYPGDATIADVRIIKLHPEWVVSKQTPMVCILRQQQIGPYRSESWSGRHGNYSDPSAFDVVEWRCGRIRRYNRTAWPTVERVVEKQPRGPLNRN